MDGQIGWMNIRMDVGPTPRILGLIRGQTFAYVPKKGFGDMTSHVYGSFFTRLDARYPTEMACRCYLVPFPMFSNFYRLDLLKKTRVALANLRWNTCKNRIENRTYSD